MPARRPIASPEPRDGAVAATRSDAAVVAAQVGRPPRAPWRVAARCTWGFPTVVVSPSRLSDGTPFPTYAWLTCPWISDKAAAAESSGATAEWCARVARDSELASRLRETDREVRERRASESGGHDECEGVGIAGQRDPLAVKCLHAHSALALAGIDDPIGSRLLLDDRACPDRRCARLTQRVSPHGVGASIEEDA